MGRPWAEQAARVTFEKRRSTRDGFCVKVVSRTLRTACAAVVPGARVTVEAETSTETSTARVTDAWALRCRSTTSLEDSEVGASRRALLPHVPLACERTTG
jgi:hypothetical protein